MNSISEGDGGAHASSEEAEVRRRMPRPSGTCADATETFGVDGKRTPAPAVRRRVAWQSGTSLAPLDAIRVLCNASVVLSHLFYTLGLPPHQHAMRAELLAHPPLRLAAIGGYAALDCFFLLTGLLSVYQLAPALAQCSTTKPQPPLQVALTYIKRRLLRLAPGYYLALGATWVAITVGKALGDKYVDHFLAFRPETFPPDAGLWDVLSSLLFIQNADLGGYMPATWSLAVQVQFSVVMPLVLLTLQPRVPGFLGRVAALALSMIALSTAWRVYRVETTGVRSLVYYQQRGDPGFNELKSVIDDLYMSTIARLCHLGLGMLLGCLALSPPLLEAIRRRWVAATSAALLAASVILAISLQVPEVEVPQGQRPGAAHAHLLFVAVLGLLQPAAVAVLLAWVLSAPGPLGELASRVLGHGAWRVPARLSYYVFLLHVLAIWVVWRSMAVLAVPPVEAFYTHVGARVGGWGELLHRVSALTWLWLAVMGVSFAGAVVLDALADRALRGRSPSALYEGAG